MKFLKIGDTYRLLYVAKNFTTGLTDITGKAVDPAGSSTTISWSGTDATVGFVELGNGVYYHDWDSTGKSEGVWVFHANSTSKDAESADSVQLVVEGTLNNTIFETIDSNIDAIKAAIEDGTYGLAQIQTELAVVDQNVDDIEALSVGSSGFAAIKGAIDAVQSSVNGIGNSTKNTWTANTPVVIPDSGSITRRIWMNIFDSAGNLEDPDSNQIEIELFDEAGTDVTTSYVTGPKPVYMTRDSVGEYYIDYTIESTDTPVQLRAKHTYLESSNAVVRDGIIDLVGALASDLENKLNTIESKIDVVDTIVDSNAIDLSNIEGKVDIIDTVVDGIQADLSNGTDGLGAIASKVDANQTDLANIESKVDIIDGIVDTINGNTDSIEGVLGTPAGASLSADIAAIKADTAANQIDLTTIEGKIDTVDTVVDSIKTDLDNPTDGLGALAGKIDTVDAVVDGIQADLSNPTDGLGALLTEIQNVSVQPGGYII